MSHLVLMAGTLAILSQALYSLVDESYVLFVDVESQKTQSSCCAATDTVQELKCLTHQIVIVLVVLIAQQVLGMQENNHLKQDCLISSSGSFQSCSCNSSGACLRLAAETQEAHSHSKKLPSQKTKHVYSLAQLYGIWGFL